tara:strand:- start:112 stop:474 length:363 start_codon:yes stop_codon:yes gene_type:complete
MEYTIPEINNGVAKIQFSDSSWTFVELTADMTEADLDDIVFRVTPPHLKTGEAPSFLKAGTTRTAAEKPIEEAADPRPKWLQNRQAAYGTTEDQIEYISENGLEAWQTKVAQIKADNPKT